eukprot:SAG22_NODE_291_length_12933_cov_5.599657_4_plen_124_part_00
MHLLLRLLSNQLNVLQLTATSGSNTLWTESAPGRGDFRPLALQYGQLHAFYGNKCRHYTLPNHTGTTRISIDFRAIPRPVYYDVRYPDGRPRFMLGAYYASFDPAMTDEDMANTGDTDCQDAG